jgi:hypothetical protein
MVYDLESGVVIARLEARNPETTRTRANFVLNDELMDAKSSMLLAIAEKEPQTGGVSAPPTSTSTSVTSSVLIFPVLHLLCSIYPSISSACKANPHMQQVHMPTSFIPSLNYPFDDSIMFL